MSEVLSTAADDLSDQAEKLQQLTLVKCKRYTMLRDVFRAAEGTEPAHR